MPACPPSPERRSTSPWRLARFCCFSCSRWRRGSSCRGSAAAPAVWSSCLLFFQVALLAGYAYAHVTRRLSLGAPGAPAPRAARAGGADAAQSRRRRRGRASDAAAPAARILLVLAVTVGAPLRRARGDRAAAAGLVRAQRYGRRLPTSCTPYLESRVAARAAGLPGRHRAVPAAPDPVARMVRRSSSCSASRAWRRRGN